MDIKELENRPDLSDHEKLNTSFVQFNKLLMELRDRELSKETVESINSELNQVNSVLESNKALSKQIKVAQSHIIKLIEKKHNLVTKNHYRNTWLAVGMAAFGIPLGVIFGISLGSMAYLGLGLPIGIAIGIAVGTEMDKKALEEGRQIDVELNH